MPGQVSLSLFFHQLTVRGPVCDGVCVCVFPYASVCLYTSLCETGLFAGVHPRTEWRARARQMTCAYTQLPHVRARDDVRVHAIAVSVHAMTYACAR